MINLKIFEPFSIKFPILLYIMGFFIHNQYLNRYSLYTYELLEAKYIYTGLLFFALVFLILFLITVRLDVTNLELLFKFYTFRILITKVISACIFLYAMIFPDKPILPIILFKLNHEIISLILYTSIFAFVFLPTLADAIGNLSKNDILFGVYLNKFLSYIAYILTPIFILLVYLNFNFLLISGFVFFILAIMISSLFGKRDAERNIFVNLSGETSKEKYKKYYNEFYSSFLILIAVWSIVNLYVISIYPYVPNSLGGSKPIQATLITTADDTLNVNVLDETNNWITIKDDSSYTQRIKVNSINKIIYK